MKKILPMMFATLWLSACGGGSGGTVTTTDVNSGVDQSGWLIPANYVMDGGPGKDGIPSLDYPTFVAAEGVDFLEDFNLVTGIKHGDVIRAYPHKILDWHEVVNDKYSDQYSVLSYCPLTGTSLGWNVDSSAENKTFGVSGLLYNSNLIMYDRQSDSYWAQMLSKSVKGSKSNQLADNFQTIETTWATWKAMYPNTEVLSSNTGFSRNYQEYPYGSYRSDDRLLFDIEVVDQRLSPKLRVLGINAGSVSKVYRIDQMAGSLDVYNDTVGDLNVVVFGSSESRMGLAFNRTLADGTTLEFTARPGELPIAMDDNDGNVWNIHGEAVSGPRQGEKLQMVESYVSYWFAWAAMFKGALIYTE